MTKLIEQTYNLNITPRQGPLGQLLVQVEGMEPMTGQDFLTWLHAASQSPEQTLRPANRNSIEVWRDTKLSPMPKAKLKEMAEFREQWKKFKRKFPQKSNEELNEMTREWLDTKNNFLANWADQFAEDLLSGKI